MPPLYYSYHHIIIIMIYCAHVYQYTRGILSLWCGDQGECSTSSLLPLAETLPGTASELADAFNLPFNRHGYRRALIIARIRGGLTEDVLCDVRGSPGGGGAWQGGGVKFYLNSLQSFY